MFGASSQFGECDRLSSEDATVSFSLEINVEQAYTEIRRIETLLYRTLGLIRRMGGGDEDLMKVVAKMQRVISILNQLRLAIALTQAAFAASGPIGWISLGLAGIGFMTFAMDMNDMIYDSTRGA